MFSRTSSLTKNRELFEIKFKLPHPQVVLLCRRQQSCGFALQLCHLWIYVLEKYAAIRLNIPCQNKCIWSCRAQCRHPGRRCPPCSSCSPPCRGWTSRRRPWSARRGCSCGTGTLAPRKPPHSRKTCSGEVWVKLGFTTRLNSHRFKNAGNVNGKTGDRLCCSSRVPFHGPARGNHQVRKRSKDQDMY